MHTTCHQSLPPWIDAPSKSCTDKADELIPHSRGKGDHAHRYNSKIEFCIQLTQPYQDLYSLYMLTALPRREPRLILDLIRIFSFLADCRLSRHFSQGFSHLTKSVLGPCLELHSHSLWSGGSRQHLALGHVSESRKGCGGMIVRPREQLTAGRTTRQGRLLLALMVSLVLAWPMPPGCTIRCTVPLWSLLPAMLHGALSGQAGHFQALLRLRALLPPQY